MRNVILRGITFYQRAISPMMASRCRFYPSCSTYAHEAISTHGLVRGGWLSAKRLGKCHPFHEGGIDIVPEINASLIKVDTLNGKNQHG